MTAPEVLADVVGLDPSAGAVEPSAGAVEPSPAKPDPEAVRAMFRGLGWGVTE